MATDDYSKGFDLSELKISDTSEVHLIDPRDGEELDASFEIYSPDSEKGRAAISRLKSRIQEFIRRNPGAKPEQKQKMFDLFEREKNISCVKSFNRLCSGGKVITDPYEACDMAPWIYRQVEQALNNEANFIKG